MVFNNDAVKKDFEFDNLFAGAKALSAALHHIKLARRQLAIAYTSIPLGACAVDKIEELTNNYETLATLSGSMSVLYQPLHTQVATTLAGRAKEVQNAYSDD